LDAYGALTSKNALHRLYFKDPGANVGPEELVERLTELEAVKEVLVRDHSEGYVAWIRFFENEEPDDIEDYLAGHLSERFGKVTRKVAQ
jgi:hypothetical protein